MKNIFVKKFVRERCRSVGMCRPIASACGINFVESCIESLRLNNALERDQLWVSYTSVNSLVLPAPTFTSHAPPFRNSENFRRSTAGSVELTEEETSQVKSILVPLGVSEEQLEDVYGVLRKAHCSAISVQVRLDSFALRKDV